jgi:prepilin-type processing-associated H-X9-DG protein
MTTCGTNARRSPSSFSPARRVRGVTLVEMLVVVAITGGLVGLLLPAVQQARESSRQAQCVNNLKQIGIGLHSFHSARGSFPTTVSGTLAPGSIGSYSWGAQLLPYTEETALADLYDYTADFDDVKNMAAVQTQVGYAVCSSKPSGPLQHPKFKVDPSTKSSMWWAAAVDYAASNGPSTTLWNAPAAVSFSRPGNTDGFFKGTVKPGVRGRKIADILDGTSKSIAVVESAGRPQVWGFGGLVPDSGLASSPATKYVLLCSWANSNEMLMRGFQQDSTKADLASQIKSPGPQIINGSNNYGVYAFHPGGANFLFADGAARFLTDATSVDVVAAMLTIKAGDAVTVP